MYQKHPNNILNVPMAGFFLKKNQFHRHNGVEIHFAHFLSHLIRRDAMRCHELRANTELISMCSVFDMHTQQHILHKWNAGPFIGWISFNCHRLSKLFTQNFRSFVASIELLIHFDCNSFSGGIAGQNFLNYSNFCGIIFAFHSCIEQISRYFSLIFGLNKIQQTWKTSSQIDLDIRIFFKIGKKSRIRQNQKGFFKNKSDKFWKKP